MVIYHGRKDHTSLGHALDRPNHLDGSLSTWMKSDLDRERRDHPVPVLQCTFSTPPLNPVRRWCRHTYRGQLVSTLPHLFLVLQDLPASFFKRLRSLLAWSCGFCHLFGAASRIEAKSVGSGCCKYSTEFVFFRVVAESSKYSSRDREGAWLQDVDHLLIQMRVLADTSSSNDMFEVLRTPWSSPWRSTATWSLSRTGSWVTPSQWPPTRR